MSKIERIMKYSAYNVSFKDNFLQFLSIDREPSYALKQVFSHLSHLT
jgi:hypothetical protein